MAKYRKASEKTIKRGKGISTDNLSLADAKEYFNERAKETGAKRFRHNGQVYDLNGNKISEAPTRSSGGGSSSSSGGGSNRPRRRPTTSDGGAKAEERRAGSPPASKPKKESPGKRGEVNPAIVAGMGAAGVAAGVAASRSGRRSSSGTSVSDKVRAAGAKAKTEAPTSMSRRAVITGGASNVPKSSTGGPARTPLKVPKVKGTGGSRGGVRGGIGVDIGGPNPLEQIRDPLQIMNKGGMVKKK